MIEYEAELGSVMGRFSDSKNVETYTNELLDLRGRVGMAIEDDNDAMNYLYRTISRELGFLTAGKGIVQEPTLNTINNKDVT